MDGQAATTPTLHLTRLHSRATPTKPRTKPSDTPNPRNSSPGDSLTTPKPRLARNHGYHKFRAASRPAELVTPAAFPEGQHRAEPKNLEEFAEEYGISRERCWRSADFTGRDDRLCGMAMIVVASQYPRKEKNLGLVRRPRVLTTWLRPSHVHISQRALVLRLALEAAARAVARFLYRTVAGVVDDVGTALPGKGRLWHSLPTHRLAGAIRAGYGFASAALPLTGSSTLRVQSLSVDGSGLDLCAAQRVWKERGARLRSLV